MNSWLLAAPPRVINVGLELFDGRPVLLPLFFAGRHATVDEGPQPRADNFSLEVRSQPIVKPGVPPDQPRLD